MKILLISAALCLAILIRPSVVMADYQISEDSAKIDAKNGSDSYDYRVIRLKSYLNSHNSPLAESADVFVAMADKYNLDWRFVAAISGVESTFGKRIPQNSYNAYGWANGTYKFESWEESIDLVSSTLREKYIDRGAVTIDQIAKRYAPPSKTWGNNVKFFMNEIDNTELNFTL